MDNKLSIDEKPRIHPLPSDSELLQFLIDNNATYLNLPIGGDLRQAIASLIRREEATR